MRIADIKKHIGTLVEIDVFLQKATISNNRDGGRWMCLDVLDITGKSQFKVWNEYISEKYLEYQGKVIHVTGKVDMYNGKIGCAVQSIEPVQEYDLRDYVAGLTDEQRKSYCGRLMQRMNQIKDESLRALIEVIFFGPDKMAEKFCELPAGLSHHHAFNGGLMVHTLEVLENAVCINQVQRTLSGSQGYAISTDTDLLIAGALLHDLGKARGYMPFPFCSMTERGKLVNHLAEGVEMLAMYNAQLGDKGVKDLSKLIHIIVSSHGKDFGQAPALKEAVIISQADMISAMVDGYDSAFKLYDNDHPGNKDTSIYWKQTESYINRGGNAYVK